MKIVPGQRQKAEYYVYYHNVFGVRRDSLELWDFESAVSCIEFKNEEPPITGGSSALLGGGLTGRNFPDYPGLEFRMSRRHMHHPIV